MHIRPKPTYDADYSNFVSPFKHLRANRPYFDEQTILKNCPSYFSGPICLENRVITGPITLNDTNLFVSVTIEPAAIK